MKLKTFLRQTRPIPASVQERFCNGRNGQEEHSAEMDCYVPRYGLRQRNGVQKTNLTDVSM